ncbi:MAG: hypothetical protein HOM11_04780 [Methylococcales bacterium]|jgi:hypothetical protein|nr:hypothetical protein [Methylococcales bacterium]MBT7444272.1 hypothetical protein [Methylococcales bacterium]
MKHKLPLPQEKKLTVLIRVEAGCLGPEGIDHVDAFCPFAEKALATLDSDFVHWEVTPRHDISKPEMEFRVGAQSVTHVQAEKYLSLFDKVLHEFEGHLHLRLAQLIEEFFGR